MRDTPYPIASAPACVAHRLAYSARAVPTRIVSLDQFRGYTVLAMFVVNFFGSYKVAPALFKHHDTYCSYADTIMPHFFFAVGFAYRLTFLRRAGEDANRGVYRRFVQRNVRLILFGAFLYLVGPAVGTWSRSSPPTLSRFVANALQEDLFQTLVHIGVTALWILPVIRAGPVARLAWAGGSAAIHVGLSQWFYYERVMTLGIDGGPLGFLTWTLPMIAGTLAYDTVARHGASSRTVRTLLWWGVIAMLLGYGLSCLNRVTPPNELGAGLRGGLIEPPFLPPSQPVNMWTMSQRAGSVSYLTFGAGLSLALYALFVWACDLRRWQIGIWRTLGTNALAGYVIHIVVGWGFGVMASRGASLGVALATLTLYVAVCYGCVRLLERRGIYWRM